MNIFQNLLDIILSLRTYNQSLDGHRDPEDIGSAINACEKELWDRTNRIETFDLYN